MQIHRSTMRLYAQPGKVLLRFLNFGNPDRILPVARFIAGMTEEAATVALQKVLDGFKGRHSNLEAVFEGNYGKVSAEGTQAFSPVKRRLLGSYFSHEYALQAAALFNPSIVLHPVQEGVEDGTCRIILSLRAVGEGHISSVVFMPGILHLDGTITWMQTDAPLSAGKISRRSENPETDYDVEFDEDVPLASRVLFPCSPAESNGIEDVRLVRFEDTYLGTYTAYNGRSIQPQWIETHDFRRFSIRTMKGMAASDKGMALFPQRIRGKYAMVGRQGGRELSIMYSDDRYVWNSYQVLQQPKRDWEMLQMGNCGSPVRTEEGWLLLTHAVGPMRKYVLSISLLDLENPSRVIASLNEPLLSPNEEEREGYVPNVLYTCGMLPHRENLVIPYAMSDRAISMARVPVREVLSALLKR